MNTSFPSSRLVFSLLLAAVFTLTGCSHFLGSSDQASQAKAESSKNKKTSKAHEKSAEAKSKQKPKKPVAQNDLWDEIREGYGLPEISDKRVANHLRWFANNQRYLDRVTEQSRPYLFYVSNELKANDMPLELALLPIVESAYDPFALSPSKALGIWQFMPQTGRSFGLEQNHWYDGRRDVVASTDAAIRYLKRLHTMFDGDWLLAVAAYNAGEGTVRRAIDKNRRQGKQADFWSLPLSQQTRSYVPQLIALSKIVADPKKYELELAAIPNSPYFTTIHVNSPVDLAQAAKAAQLDAKELRYLNAGYNRWITTPSGPHQLLVPVGDATQFTLALEQLPKLKPIQIAGDYKVKAGDTLGALAKRYGTSVAAIQATNNLKGTNLRIGQSLSIPGQAPAISAEALQAEQQLAQRKQSNNTLTYTVKSGDSFWTIAKKNGTSVKNLLKWNNLNAKATLKPGQKLVLADNAITQKDGNKITYQIKAGDTLHKIANKFSVSKKEILSWNKVKNESYIHPGQELVIFLSAKN